MVFKYVTGRPHIVQDHFFLSFLKNHSYSVSSKTQLPQNFILVQTVSSSNLWLWLPVSIINLRQWPSTLPWLWPSAFFYLQDSSALRENILVACMFPTWNSQKAGKPGSHFSLDKTDFPAYRLSIWYSQLWRPANYDRRQNLLLSKHILLFLKHCFSGLETQIFPF